MDFCFKYKTVSDARKDRALGLRKVNNVRTSEKLGRNTQFNGGNHSYNIDKYDDIIEKRKVCGQLALIISYKNKLWSQFPVAYGKE